MMDGVLAVQADSMGWPAWMVSSQAAAHVPACSIPALSSPGETDLSQTLPWVGPWTAQGERSRGGIWLRAPAGGVGEAPSPLAYVSLVDPTLLGSRKVLSH